ncbi:MAG: hypothetical protein HY443_01000 [Candidatus Nealsonbacteria bacterium]|nr:hypothetical protein [Candidatus Nealsonbacteria bacterium]
MNKGFTLIEALVVALIILTMTALILPNFRLGERQFALQRSAGKLAQDLRRAQGLAMSAAAFSCPGSQKLKGYGILFESADPNNTFYKLVAKCADGTDTAVEKERIPLEKKIRIKELRKDDSVVPSLSVFFYPPDPQTDLEGAIGVTVVLASSEGETAVRINKTGLINVE